MGVGVGKVAARQSHSKGSFIRWQGIALTQLGYAVNLILTLATASLGFAIALIKDKDFTPGCWGKCFLILSQLSLLASVGLGIWCVVNRLLDFRKTKDNARDQEYLTAHPEREEVRKTLEKRREETGKLGKRTWRIFWWQTGTFGLGVLLLLVAVALAYNTKLF
jgi:hypothetical protein